MSLTSAVKRACNLNLRSCTLCLTTFLRGDAPLWGDKETEIKKSPSDFLKATHGCQMKPSVCTSAVLPPPSWHPCTDTAAPSHSAGDGAGGW